MTITSGGIPETRVHITNPRDWGSSIGTDYWASFGDLTLVEADSTDLDLHGWLEAGTWVYLKGTGADLLTSSDIGTSGGAHMDTADDSLTSPFIFGDYAHALAVSGMLGYIPDTLNCEVYGRFTLNNDEETSGFGFVKGDAATVFAKDDLLAYFATNGTDFTLENASAAADGSTDNTNAHQLRMVLQAGQAIDWYIDDTLQSNTLALLTDEFPVAFCIQAATGGTNDPVVEWVHIWYS